MSEFRRILEVNTIGSFCFIHYVMPIMQAQGDGVIVNTSSGDATAAYTYEVGYSASKAAVKQMTRDIANECGEGGKIRCCSVSPGWVATPMATQSIADFSGQDFDNASEVGDLGPLGRMVERLRLQLSSHSWLLMRARFSTASMLLSTAARPWARHKSSYITSARSKAVTPSGGSLFLNWLALKPTQSQCKASARKTLRQTSQG